MKGTKFLGAEPMAIIKGKSSRVISIALYWMMGSAILSIAGWYYGGGWYYTGLAIMFTLFSLLMHWLKVAEKEWNPR
jgi:hypothetical protein